MVQLVCNTLFVWGLHRGSQWLCIEARVHLAAPSLGKLRSKKDTTRLEAIAICEKFKP